MQYNTFYIPIGDNGEAQEQLNAFLRGHRVLQVERHVFEGGWGFCVEWLDGTVSTNANAKWKTTRVDYREILDEESFARFVKLRERRKAIAAEDGIAPYMVLTDAQIAETAKLEMLTRTAFVAIPGVGDARAKKFFDRLTAQEPKTGNVAEEEGTQRNASATFGRQLSNLTICDWHSGKPARGSVVVQTSGSRANLDMELARLREGLIEGCYPVGHYNKFKIFDPKERQICAASFGERVLHHALMNVCEPYFDRRLIFDTYACRTGKGQRRAVARARQFAARHTWYLKCDIAKFFDSIPHVQLKMTLRKVFKDRILLDWFDRIVDTYSVKPGFGLPIGNLTSQHFANLYMDKIDRLCGLPYVRYMDDFVFWADDKNVLRAVLVSVRIVADSLGLQLKDSPEIRETRGGMDFLGMWVFPGRIRANRRSIRRYERRVAEVELLNRFGRISEDELQDRVSAMTAFLQQGDTLEWRRKFWGTRREASGANRVMRGGSWNNDADNCRSSNRNNNTPSNDNNNNGFRLFCSAAPQGSELAVPARFPSLERRGEYRCDSALVGREPKITNRSFILEKDHD